jgi:heptosyltransferase-2
MLPVRPNILVIETGLLGELFVVTPALRAIRRAYPEGRVTALVSPGSAAILKGNPGVQRMLPLSREERRGMGALRVASWIRAQHFDAAFVFHTSFRSALTVAMSRVRIRAGLSCEGRRPLLTHAVPRDRDAYEVDEHLRVVGLLGIEPDGRELDLFLTEEERCEAEELLSRAGVEGVLVGLHPGASRDIRRWPAERFAELGLRVVSELKATPVFFFGPGEQDLAELIVKAHKANGSADPLVIFPRSVRALGALFQRMGAVVTNNTGPMHVAAAVRIPGVFIHGPTPVTRWHPPGDMYVSVHSQNIACRPCDASHCKMKSLLCMEAVTTDEVFKGLTSVLGGQTR